MTRTNIAITLFFTLLLGVFLGHAWHSQQGYIKDLKFDKIEAEANLLNCEDKRSHMIGFGINQEYNYDGIGGN